MSGLKQAIAKIRQELSTNVDSFGHSTNPDALAALGQIESALAAFVLATDGLSAAASPGPWEAEQDGSPHKGRVRVCERSVEGWEIVAHFYCGARTGHGATNAKFAAAACNAARDLLKAFEGDDD